VRELIANAAGEDAILKAALEGGMKYISEDGIDKINLGITTIDELFRVVHLL
jgi:type II secretory ATPase GspE/PulE/Tfp pilus assembly ATPase PilB-like protein